MMLRSSFAEGQMQLSSLNPPDLPLSDDNVDTVIRLCQVLHCRFQQEKDAVLAYEALDTRSNHWSSAGKALVDLAQLAHKWDCLEAVRPTLESLRASLGRWEKQAIQVPAPWDFRTLHPGGWTPYHEVTVSFFSGRGSEIPENHGSDDGSLQ